MTLPNEKTLHLAEMGIADTTQKVYKNYRGQLQEDKTRKLVNLLIDMALEAHKQGRI